MAQTKRLPRPQAREAQTAHSHIWLPFLYSYRTLCLGPGSERALRFNGFVGLKAAGDAWGHTERAGLGWQPSVGAAVAISSPKNEGHQPAIRTRRTAV